MEKEINPETLLEIAENAKEILKAKSEETGLYTNIYNQSLNCLAHATEIVRLVSFGQSINVRSVDKALLRCLLDVFAKMAYMMKHKDCEPGEQEKVFRAMEKAYLESRKRVFEKRIEFLENNEIPEHPAQEQEKLKNNLIHQCKEAKKRIEEHEEHGIKENLDMNKMVREMYNLVEQESFFAMYDNCHVYVHGYPGHLNESCEYKYNHTDVYRFYAFALFELNDYLPKEDRERLNFLISKIMLQE